MTSSDTPSTIEEKYFRFVNNISDSKNIDENLIKDFINKEMDRRNINVESPAEDKTETELSNIKEDLLIANESVQNKQKCSITPDSETITMNNNHNGQSIDSESEPKNEDNDNNDNIPIEISTGKQPDESIDDNLPKTVKLLRTSDGGKCYLVGTAHFSIESQKDVSRVIQAVQPHIVIVELCVDRIHVLDLDEETFLQEAKNLNFNNIMYTIKQNGIYKGLFYLLLLNMSAHFTKVLGLAPGGEFRTALMEANKIPNCIVLMGDRPIKITFARALSFLTWWQKIKLAWQLLTEKEIISQKDVERYKCPNSLEEIMAELGKEYPALEEVFVKERDIYLTHSLQLACKSKIGKFGEPIPAKVVGVVGIGHTLGIVQNWGKVNRSQISPIMSIPPPSLSSKVLKFTVKASVIGTIIYVGYKLIPLPIDTILSLKSSVESFIKVSPS